MEARRRSTSVKWCANASTVRATRSRPAPRNSTRSSGAGRATSRTPVISQDTPEFARIHPRRDRQDDRERAVGVRQEAIGIGNDPLASGVAPCRCINGRNRDVDAMRLEARLASEGAEVKTVTAAGIENDVARRCDDRSPRWRRSSGSVTPRSCNRRRPATAAAVSPGCFDRRSCGWSRLMYPLRATSNECPCGQNTRRSSRSNAMWQPRTGQRSMDRVYRAESMRVFIMPPGRCRARLDISRVRR